jgi:hypothetical protein
MFVFIYFFLHHFNAATVNFFFFLKGGI